jgi:benzoyl-CoA reductase/2-hydroxyglutaryl-CoA dehydratase subunit BcrC/BadD/HgdB
MVLAASSRWEFIQESRLLSNGVAMITVNVFVVQLVEAFNSVLLSQKYCSGSGEYKLLGVFLVITWLLLSQ